MRVRGCGTGTSYAGDDAQRESREILTLGPRAGCPERDRGVKNHAAAHISTRQPCLLRGHVWVCASHERLPQGLIRAWLRDVIRGCLPALRVREFSSSSADPTRNPGHLAAAAPLRKPAPLAGRELEEVCRDNSPTRQKETNPGLAGNYLFGSALGGELRMRRLCHRAPSSSRLLGNGLFSNW